MDLFVVVAHLSMAIVFFYSNQVVDPLPPVSGNFEKGQVATEDDGALGRATTQGRASGGSPHEDAL